MSLQGFSKAQLNVFYPKLGIHHIVTDPLWELGTHY